MSVLQPPSTPLQPPFNPLATHTPIPPACVATLEGDGRTHGGARAFTVTFRAEPGVDATLALRALLKRALRSHGLRCIAIEAAMDRQRVLPAAGVCGDAAPESSLCSKIVQGEPSR